MYNTPALDFNLRFATAALARLEMLLAPPDRAPFRMRWSHTHDAWPAYLADYMAGISRFCLKQGNDPVMNPDINPVSNPASCTSPRSSAGSSSGSACTGDAIKQHISMLAVAARG